DLALTVVHEQDRERVRSEWERILTQKRRGTIRFRWVAIDGRVLWVEAHVNPIVEEHDKIVGLHGVTMDISEQHLSEVARRHTEERNRAILNAIPDLMFLQTRDGVFLDYHARSLKEFLGSPENLIGKNMRDVFPTQLADDFLSCFERADDLSAPQV